MWKRSVFPYAQHFGELSFDNSWVYTHGGSTKKEKVVYTPMVGSPTISVMLYEQFIVSPKLKVYPFTLVFLLDSQNHRTRY